MTEFVIHTIDSAPAASTDILRAVEKKYGFVPNADVILVQTGGAVQTRSRSGR